MVGDDWTPTMGGLNNVICDYLHPILYRHAQSPVRRGKAAKATASECPIVPLGRRC